MTADEAIKKCVPRAFTREVPKQKVYLLDNEDDVLFEMGRNTTKTQYQARADTVQKWWGLWGLCAFKTGYERRGGKNNGL